ncbi:TPA: hypothetical protein QBF70_001477 [Escherichia coli O113:H4]|nr:hypothetical protein [Escherichia coli O113:H4]
MSDLLFRAAIYIVIDAGRKHHSINSPIVKQAKESAAQFNAGRFMRGKFPFHCKLLKLFSAILNAMLRKNKEM